MSPSTECILDTERFGAYEYSSACSLDNLSATYTYAVYPMVNGIANQTITTDKSKCVLTGSNLQVEKDQVLSSIGYCDIVTTIHASAATSADGYSECYTFKVMAVKDSARYIKAVSLSIAMSLFVVS